MTHTRFICIILNLTSIQTELCTQMDRLSLTRILFVGDHTTMTQAISLASILGDNTAISTDPNVVPNFEKTITCAGTGIGSFTLEYVRNDRLEEPGTAPSPGTPNCGPTNEQYCYPWSADYQAHVGKQLLVVNTGYHWGDDWQGYITNFQNFVGRIDEIAGANAARVSTTFPPVQSICLVLQPYTPSCSPIFIHSFHVSSRPTTSSCSARQSQATRNATSTTSPTDTTESIVPASSTAPSGTGGASYRPTTTTPFASSTSGTC